MANTGIATIVSLNNPLTEDRLDVSHLTKILDAKATVFSEEWSVPIPGKSFTGVSGEGCIDPSCLATFFEAAIGTQVPQESRKNLFASQNDQQTAGSIMKSFIDQGNTLLYGSCFDNLWNGLAADSLSYYMHTQRNINIGCTRLNQVFTGDTISLGSCNIVFDYVNNSTQAIADYNNYMDIQPDGYTPPCNGSTCGGDEYRVVNDSCGFTIKKVKVVLPFSGGCAYDSVLYDIFKVHAICSPVNVQGCLSAVGSLFNPYYTGMLGNWRAKSQYIYHVNRQNIPGNSTILGSTDIRKSGAYSLFNPFWKYDVPA